MKNNKLAIIILLILFSGCQKEESKEKVLASDYRDAIVGTYRCNGRIFGFRGANPRDTFNVSQYVEKYSDSSLIIKYGIYQTGIEAIDTVIVRQDSFAATLNSFEFYYYGGTGRPQIHCIDGVFVNDSIFISYKLAGCLNPAYSYFLIGPKID